MRVGGLVAELDLAHGQVTVRAAVPERAARAELRGPPCQVAGLRLRRYAAFEAGEQERLRSVVGRRGHTRAQSRRGRADGELEPDDVGAQALGGDGGARVVGGPDEARLEALHRGQEQRPGGRRGDRSEALDGGVEPASAAPARIERHPVLVLHTRVQAGDPPRDHEPLTPLAAGEPALAADLAPAVRAGLAQLPPDPAVQVLRVLAGAALQPGLESGGVGGYVGGALELEAAPAGEAGEQEDEGGGMTFRHAVSIGNLARALQ